MFILTDPKATYLLSALMSLGLVTYLMIWIICKRRKYRREMIKELKELRAPKKKEVVRPPVMQNNCSCTGKKEDWQWYEELGCWYVVRECGHCEYYWEGPNYLYDDPQELGNTLE